MRWLLRSRLIDQFFVPSQANLTSRAKTSWVVRNCLARHVKICDARRLGATMVSMSPVISLLLGGGFCAMTWAARLMASVSVIVSLLARLIALMMPSAASVQARRVFKVACCLICCLPSVAGVSTGFRVT